MAKKMLIIEKALLVGGAISVVLMITLFHSVGCLALQIIASSTIVLPGIAGILELFRTCEL